MKLGNTYTIRDLKRTICYTAEIRENDKLSFYDNGYLVGHANITNEGIFYIYNTNTEYWMYAMMNDNDHGFRIFNKDLNELIYLSTLDN